MTKEKPKRTGGSAATLAPWLRRIAIALVAGAVVGVGGGLLAMQWLQPPIEETVAEPEPSTLPTAEAPRRRAMRGPRADGMRGDEFVGSGAIAQADSLAVVPDLVGRTEGDARRLLTRAGFTLGDLLFQEDDGPVGLVLSTFPVPGERIALPATVNLVLSDRRRGVDTTGFGFDTLSFGVDTTDVDTSLFPIDTISLRGDSSLFRIDTSPFRIDTVSATPRS